MPKTTVNWIFVGIAVYVDPERPDRHRMELPFLPKKQADPIIRT